MVVIRNVGQGINQRFPKHNLSLKESKQKLIAENNDLKGKLRKFEEKVKK